MVPVSKDLLPDNKPKPLTVEEIEKRRTLARQRHQEQQLAKSEQGSVDQVAIDLQAKLSVDEPQDVDPLDVDDDVFIGFARVYSGTLRKGAKIYALMPKHDPRLLK